jgi:hypothetical protein
MQRDQLFAAHARPHDFDAALKYDEQVAVPLAGLDQDLAMPRFHAPAVLFDARELGGSQHRKCLRRTPGKYAGQ